MPNEDVNRRTFLQYGGTAAATAASVGLAGCGDDTGSEDNGSEGTSDDTMDAELRAFDEELPDDPTREELLQQANGRAHEQAPFVYLHRQFSIYGLNTDLDWEVRSDEDILVREFDTDLEEATVTQGTFPTAIDPADHNDTPTYNVLDQTYEQVLYRDREGRVIDRIATDWERVDETTIELEIRDGVTFHTGNEMTPDDVAFSINRFNDPERSEQASNLGDIEEARVEDGTVVLDLNAVVPTIFINLTSFGRVMERAWTEERDRSDLNAGEANGTGAYELVEFSDDVEVVFERFDDYWDDNPGPDRLVFNAVEDGGTRVDRLIAGESDFITNVNPGDVSRVEEEDGIEILGAPSIRIIFLVMNDAKEPFDSVEFRQAMNFAVDVEAIIDGVLNGFGEVTSQPTLSDHFGHNPRVEPYDYDPDRAETLVEASGYADTDITVNTTTGRYLRDSDVAETAAEQINQLENVNADAELRDTQALFSETLDGDQETSPAIFLIGWGNPTLDTDYALREWVDPEGAFGVRHFNDERLVELLDQAEDKPNESAN